MRLASAFVLPLLLLTHGATADVDDPWSADAGASSATPDAAVSGPACSSPPSHERALIALKYMRIALADPFYSQATDGYVPEQIKTAALRNVSGQMANLMTWVASLHCDALAVRAAELRDAAETRDAAKATADRWTQVATGELACRASDRCMALRVCEVDARLADLRQQIATERANAAGVVDLALLHQLGTAVQQEVALRGMRLERFKEERHKPFTPAMCASSPRQ